MFFYFLCLRTSRNKSQYLSSTSKILAALLSKWQKHSKYLSGNFTRFLYKFKRTNKKTWNQSLFQVSDCCNLDSFFNKFRNKIIANSEVWQIYAFLGFTCKNKYLYVMHCAIWYHLYNFKNVKNTHGGVLILVKLQAEA